jgi:ubiquinone/menaquinone biosynthesis C-methylase UbiE
MGNMPLGEVKVGDIMAGSHHAGHLGAVYQAGNKDELAKIYDNWAESYDAEMASIGYRHPTVGLALLSRHLPRGSAPLLDAGAGTGLIGEWLSIMGYPHVEALDISDGMLAIAAKKNVYAALHNLALGDTLPFETGQFAGVVAVGVFSSGHVGPEGLDELIRICKSGAIIVLTVKDTLWENGFADRILALEAQGLVSRVEETPPYVSMPGEVGTIPSRGLVLKVNS